MFNISRKLLVLVGLVGILGLVTSASANIIANGGFEETDVSDKKWAWFTSSSVIGWDGSNIEIWDSYGSVTAYEGEQHAELNAHPSNGNAFSIFQTIETEIGALYDVSFAYSARMNSNESFMFDLSSFDNSFLSVIMDDHEVNAWSVFNVSFEAIDLFTTIGFTSITPSSRTVGNFLDDISIVKSLEAQVSTVSAPSITFIMMLACAFFIRRQIMSKINN